jgi:hypothetical protein
MDTKQTVILVSARKDQLGDFIEGLKEDRNITLRISGTAEEAIASVGGEKSVVVVVDNPTRDNSALGLVRRLIEVNAFAHTAVLSDRSDEEFHHLSEGLGILAKLPIRPGRVEAKRLLGQLRGLNPPP